ncbi:MAG: phage tail tape measure protein, partial [Streptosporangiales bacterium]
MASRTTDLYARIVGDSSSYEKALGKAKEGTRQFERELARLERERKAAMGQVGRVAAVTGAAILAGVGLSVRAAVKWESAWAGVTKTVNGSKEQMAALEGGLRDLARTLPASHEEIAKVAESAGQLGVKRKDILSFTKTMIDMGVSTDLTADQAATSMARFANIMGTPTRQIGKLGATIVNLGNKGASTESEIVDMGLRIAGAGRQIGLSEGEVLGFANALSSVGIRAEAGGSAISRVFVTMSQAVEKGGNDLDTFARVAGMSADQFKQKFQKDAAGATVAFITGLGQMNKTGKSTFGTLNQLGFSGIRVRDTLLRASNASDVFAKSIRDGNTAWRDGSALIKEANKRYATTESQLRIARNRLDDFAISMGETFLPAVAGAADTLGGFLDVLNGLPKPAKQALGILGGVSGAVLGIGGAALIAVPKVGDFMDSLRTMGTRGARLAGGLSRVGSVLTGPWGLAIGGAITILGIFIKKKADAAREVRDFTRSIQQDNGAIGENTRLLAAQKLQDEGVLDAAHRLGISYSDVTDAAIGNHAALRRVNTALDENGRTIAFVGNSSQGAQHATRIWTGDAVKLRQAISGQNDTVSKAVGKNKQLKAATDQGAGAAKKHGRSVQGEANAMDRAQISAQDLKNALDRLNGR